MNKKLVLLGCGLALAAILVVAVILFFYVSSAYNGLVSLDEAVAAGWSQVENVYQRRADLVPNLVATVQGAADFERETLEAVISARSRATGVQLSASDLQNPQALAQFEAGPGGAFERALTPHGGGRALPRHQGQPELPEPPG